MKRVPVWKNYSEDESKRFLPTVVGCVGTKDTKLHFRFEASYPTESPPYSFSQAWGENRSEKEAALACLRWAWARHEEGGGSGPPMELEQKGIQEIAFSRAAVTVRYSA